MQAGAMVLKLGGAKVSCAWSLLSLIFVAGLLVLSAPNAAQAQSLAPVRINADANGVDVVSGTFNVITSDVSIGQPGMGGLSFGRISTGGLFYHNHRGEIAYANVSGVHRYTVSLGAVSRTFTASTGTPNSSTTFTPEQLEGLALSYNATTQRYTMTAPAGTYTYGLQGSNAAYRILSFASWSGEIVTYHYATAFSPTLVRLQSVTNNLGYQLDFDYASNSTSSGQEADWQRITKVTGLNNAVDYCDPTTDTCSYSIAWPYMSYGESLAGSALTVTATDPLSQATSYVFDTSNGGRITSKDGETVSYSSNRVSAVGSTTYGYSDAGNVRTTTVTDPLTQPRTVTGDIANNRIDADRNALNQTTSYQYTNGLVSRITRPLGDYTSFTYDGRGNLTQAQLTQNGGSPTITTYSASYPSSPSNAATDNLPSWTRDGLSNQTDYTYDTTTGQVLTVTLPDPDGGSALPRPQTRYTYGTAYAAYKISSSSITTQSAGVSRLSQTSSCRTSAWSGSACGAGNSDEVRTILSYGASFGSGSANNLLPTSTETKAGDNSLSATTAMTYTAYSDVASVDGPLSGADDTTRYYFNSLQQLVGVIGPDPDAGGGAYAYRATHYEYDSEGQNTVIEQGTTATQPTNGSWPSFSVLQRRELEYDSGHVVVERVRASSGSSVLSVVQRTYDSLGRLNCATVRMNPSEFTSAPPGACSLDTTGSYGPDRIRTFGYDSVNRVTQVTEGYLSGSTIVTSVSFNANGQVASETDGASNVTTYAYDGYGRLWRVCYAGTTSCSGTPSNSNYEEYSYNNAGAVTGVRLRDAQTISNTLDNLQRVTLRDAPSASADVSFAYDNFSRVVSQTRNSQTLSFGYDALGRNTSQTQPLGAVNYQYDLAGRRTRITWPDGFCAQYDYDLANAVTQIRAEGGSCTSTTLASYAYDNLGRRTSITRGNSTTETATFDTLSRLTQLAQNLDGSTYDQTLDFSYNQANQIVSRTGSSTAFNHPAPAPAATSYAHNALNQITSINGGAALSYDSRGNLQTHASGTQGFDIDNSLTGLTASGPTTLAAYEFDALGRLSGAGASSVSTRFLYDGDQIVAEYNAAGSTLLRRYVPGVGVDEPILWYEGSGTSDRRWLIADERGSIIAVTNGSGAATGSGFGVNTYDEYGVPGSSNLGRFQYTGQAWLSETGLYHYRARAYNPTLGRFLQPDPIGTEGGMNLYAYVGDDPVNASDPSGLVCVPTGEETLVRGPNGDITDIIGHVYCGIVIDFGDPAILVEQWFQWARQQSSGSLVDPSGELQRRRQALCEAGNGFVTLSGALQIGSYAMYTAAGVAAVVAIATGAPVVVGGAIAAASVLGAASAISLTIGGGLQAASDRQTGMQNFSAGVASLGVGAALGALTPYARGAVLSVRERAINAFASNGRGLIGGVMDGVMSATPSGFEANCSHRL